MRRAYDIQQKLIPPWVDHRHAKELAAMSDVLDGSPNLPGLVACDLLGDASPRLGSPGMTGDQVLRAAVLKQLNQFSYEALAFHLADSSCYRAFCGYGFSEVAPKRATLAENIAKVSASTWAAINKVLVKDGLEAGVDSGERVRIDCTVVDSDIHEPSDSELLWDTVRVLARWLKRARDAGVAFEWTNHTRRTRRRAREILYARRKAKRFPPYRDLIRVTELTLGYADRALAALRRCEPSRKVGRILERIEHFTELGRQVVDQTRRRVLEGESVPAGEKLVSIFEDHADIISKGRRKTQYGHKIKRLHAGRALDRPA